MAQPAGELEHTYQMVVASRFAADLSVFVPFRTEAASKTQVSRIETQIGPYLDRGCPQPI